MITERAHDDRPTHLRYREGQEDARRPADRCGSGISGLASCRVRTGGLRGLGYSALKPAGLGGDSLLERIVSMRKQYPRELRERAVRLVAEHCGEYETEYAAIRTVAAKPAPVVLRAQAGLPCSR